MSKLIKGNFNVKNEIKDEKNLDSSDTLEAEFEKEALKHLGGSIAFVSKRKVLWEEKEKLGAKKNKK